VYGQYFYFFILAVLTLITGNARQICMSLISQVVQNKLIV